MKFDINTVKSHWKEILIGCLVLFSMNKCTTSCSHNSRANKAEVVCDSLQHVVDSQKIVISDLCKDTANYINQIRMYTHFELKQNEKDSMINSVVQKNNEVTQRNNNLSRQNRNLQNQLNNK